MKLTHEKIRFNVLGLFGIAASIVGCSSSVPLDYARAYPGEVRHAEVFDIQVNREVTEIVLTNTTARSFGPSTLWLNAQFSRPIDGLRIGQTIRLPLSSFRNEFSEPFRAGGFFAIERPDVIVLAQLETEGELFGLTVVEGAAE